ncbi:unnamed protein product [Agarophyton chilense]
MEMDNDETKLEDQEDQGDYSQLDPLRATHGTEHPDQLDRILITDLLNEQLTDNFCTAIRSRLNGGEDLPFSLDSRGILLRHVEKHDQIVVPHALKSRVLYLAHYAKLSGNPGGTKMFMTLRRDFYCPTLAMDCHATVKLCRTCAIDRVKLYKKRKKMTLFPAKAPLQFVSIDILGELIRSNQGYRYLLLITDRFSKLLRTVPLKRITALVKAQAFIKHWVYVYGPPEVLLSDNGKQFGAMFFQNVERYNPTLLAALRHYIADHPKEWDMYTDTLCYTYNAQVHTSTKAAPFDLVISRNLPSLRMRLDEVKEDKPTPEQNHLRWRIDLRLRTEQAGPELAKTQARYKRNSNDRRRRQLSDLRVGRYSFLRVARLEKQDGPRHKLLPVESRPFKVMELTNNTVVLKTGEDVERFSRDRVETAPDNPETQETEKESTVH